MKAINDNAMMEKTFLTVSSEHDLYHDNERSLCADIFFSVNSIGRVVRRKTTDTIIKLGAC